MKYLAVLVAMLTPSALFAQSCSDWSTYEFWEEATSDVVTSCLASNDATSSANNDKYAMHYAAGESDYPEVIQLLIDAGGDVDQPDAQGTTPLHAAARNQNPDIIAVLIAAGADLTAAGEGGATVLHIAALHNAPAVLTQLMDAGADLYAEDWDGNTPFDYAKRGQTDHSLNNYLILKQAM